jgi:hypothetical protein
MSARAVEEAAWDGEVSVMLAVGVLGAADQELPRTVVLVVAVKACCWKLQLMFG